MTWINLSVENTKEGKQREREISGEKGYVFEACAPGSDINLRSESRCAPPALGRFPISSATFGPTWPPLPPNWTTDRRAGRREWFGRQTVPPPPPLRPPLPPPPPPPPPARENEGRVGGGGWTDLQRVQRVAGRAQDQSDGVHARPGECARGSGSCDPGLALGSRAPRSRGLGRVFHLCWDLWWC